MKLSTSCPYKSRWRDLILTAWTLSLFGNPTSWYFVLVVCRSVVQPADVGRY